MDASRPCSIAKAAEYLGLPHWKVLRVLKALDKGSKTVLVNVSRGQKPCWLVVGGALDQLRLRSSKRQVATVCDDDSLL
jgi:hypothetical protein